MAAFLNWKDDFSAYTAGNALPNATNGWTVPADANAFEPLVVTTAHDLGTGPQFGGKMLEMNRLSSGSPLFSGAKLDFSDGGITVGEEILLRYWCRCDSDHYGQEHPGDGSKYFRFVAAATLSEFGIFIVHHGSPTENYTAEFQINQETTVTYFGGTGGPGTDEWVKFEFYAHMPASGDWTTRGWLNDTQIHQKTTWGAGEKPERLFTASNSDGMPDDDNHFYVDKIEIFTDVDSGLGIAATTGTMAGGDVDVNGGGGTTRRGSALGGLG